MIFSIPRVYAAKVELGGPISGEGLGPFATGTPSETTAFKQLAGTVSSIIGVLTVAGAIWFLFNLVIGGIQWISAGGDKHALEEAQKRIQNALVGMIIVVAAWTIYALMGKFLGLDVLLQSDAVLKALKLQ
jgi:hypothetical protein